MPELQKTTHEKLIECFVKMTEGVNIFIEQMNVEQSMERRMFQAGMFVRFLGEYLTSMEKIVRNDAQNNHSGS